MKVDRESLARFAALRLRAPGHATSLQQGDRRSPFLGRGVEFADYRAYDPGDDIRLIDWNVYLRLGLALVRQFNEERSLSVKIFLDTSTSMEFGRPRKADHGAQLAMSLATVALAHRDPVVFCCYGGDAKPVRAKAVNTDGLAELLHIVERVEPGGRGDAYAQIGSQLGQGRTDRLVLITDLLLEPEERAQVLKLMAASSRHPVLLHVLSQDELRPDLEDVSKIVDAETGEELDIRDGGSVARQYDDALKAWLADVEGRCRQLGIQYLLAESEKAVEELVHGNLHRARIVEHAAGGAQ